MSSFATTNEKTIAEAFAEFHAANPKVYDLFKEQVYRALRVKKEMVSSKAIINWIRWEVSLNMDTKDTYKINDAFTSHYARLFIKDHPHYADMFEVRVLRDGSEKGTARINDSYRISILKKMNSGYQLIHFPANNTVVLKHPDSTVENPITENVTTVSFNKLMRDKYISLETKTDFATTYKITDTGVTFAQHG